MIADEMVHGRLPRSGDTRWNRQPRSVRSARRPYQRPGPLPLPERRGWGEWDASGRLWKEIQMRRDQAGETDGPPWRPRARIEDDTPVVPRAAAELVCEEASRWLGEPFPRQWVAELADRANLVYQHNARFRQLLRRRGDIGRDLLSAFMRHWLHGLLASRRPDLCQRLPGPYAAGRDLAQPSPDSAASCMTCAGTGVSSAEKRHSAKGTWLIFP
jgi:hypothetical protein